MTKKIKNKPAFTERGYGIFVKSVNERLKDANKRIDDLEPDTAKVYERLSEALDRIRGHEHRLLIDGGAALHQRISKLEEGVWKRIAALEMAAAPTGKKRRVRPKPGER